MSEQKKKTVRVGTILNGKYGPFMVLGSGKNSKPQYTYTVEIRVKDSAGNVVYQGKNPLVKMFKPKSETKAVQHELAVAIEDNS